MVMYNGVYLYIIYICDTLIIFFKFFFELPIQLQ